MFGLNGKSEIHTKYQKIKKTKYHREGSGQD